MGFLSKKKDDSEDSNRSSLFSSRKKDKDSSAGSNPYAQPEKKDPYASQPPAYPGGNDNYRQEKSPAYTSQQSGFSSQGGNYGGQSGYGSDRYGGGQNQTSGRQGGYGGMGRSDSNNTMSTDAGRQELFGGAPQRQQAQGNSQGSSGAYGGGGGGYGQAPSRGYGAYNDRELTAEEQEEEDVSATKNEIKFMKQQDVSSTRNALRLAQQAEETGRDTLARLGAQGERLHNTEKNLDLATTQNKIAADKTKELNTLNKSMFAVHVANPFTKQSRRDEQDRKVMEHHDRDRDAREATRKAAWEQGNRNDQLNRDMANTGRGPGKSTLADRAKYQFEADSDDDAMENEIDDNLDQLHGAAKRLNMLGRAMGNEVEKQNKDIDRISGKVDRVDGEVSYNSHKLNQIK